jgi:hypothetical protein
METSHDMCAALGRRPLTPTSKGDQRTNAAIQQRRHDRPDFHRNHGSAALRSTTERDGQSHLYGLSDPCGPPQPPLLGRSASSSLPPSNAPAAESRQHHEVEAPQVETTSFRQARRVHSRLVGLAESGRIDREQLEAAVTWGDWAERVSGTTYAPTS